jgi:hypothetical protein
MRRKVQRREGMLGAQQEQTAAVVRLKREREAACEAAAAKPEGGLRARAAELVELRGAAAARQGAGGQGAGGGGAAEVQHVHGAGGDDSLERVRALPLRLRLGECVAEQRQANDEEIRRVRPAHISNRQGAT